MHPDDPLWKAEQVLQDHDLKYLVVQEEGVAVITSYSIHYTKLYELDEDGCVRIATIVTPTAINQVAMEEQLCADLQGAPDDPELPRKAAKIVRTFDPCISCAVHVLKK